MPQAILLVSARDRTGIVAALSDLAFRYNGNILNADQHSDEESDMFFMRLVWSLDGFTLDIDGIRDALSVLARGFDGMQWQLFTSEEEPKIVLFCSKTPHCLYDLLLREKMGELGGRIVHVISNHPDLADVSNHFDVPFTCIPVEKEKKAEAEAAQIALIEEVGGNVVVLARYMQILSPKFVAHFPQQIINIHHSFLPAFAGAKPYHQAKARGVKVIGATAHYVTATLDEGPIIEQDVAQVTHRDGVQDLIRKGRDLERRVLGQAVRLHLQRRVLVESNRTVVFQ